MGLQTDGWIELRMYVQVAGKMDVQIGGDLGIQMDGLLGQC